ncbi:hypothetical protein [Caballeronia terrestris]|uniref:hypothetical protein n=1 Tax=Caballeronia terrestris TaxID=1226301 RepID=UPI001F18953F|nr:hypothetical protein [Caballeronia terrestris]
MKPFEQIVGELISGGRNKVFQVVTHGAKGAPEIFDCHSGPFGKLIARIERFARVIGN